MQTDLSNSPTSNVTGATADVATVVVEGLARPLYYMAIPLGGSTDACAIGSEVKIELGNRTTNGYVVEMLPYASAIAELEARAKMEAERAGESGGQELPQLALFSKDSIQTRGISLKSILSSVPVFLPEQIQVFRWMSEYYGVNLFDVIDNALPKRAERKRKAKAAAAVDSYIPHSPDQLTPGQDTAFKSIKQSIDSNTFSPILLFGVTGSGKTEVYIRAVKEVLAQGRGALIIVPEIALTPQLFDQFKARLGSELALLHSQIAPIERWESWHSLMTGKIRVGLGARSAVFAPIPDLGLIVVDEEHENSYKQSDGVRYHGRDVAVMRAKFANCPIVLGSATPSFESLLNVSKQRYSLAEIPDRVTMRPLPQLQIVDLNKIRRNEMPSENISPQLHAALAETLERGGQAVILYNRRGFSSYLQCETCGESVLCPDCSVTLTFHKRQNRLVCHYCSLSVAAPSHCGVCRNPKTSKIDTDDKKLAKAAENVGILLHRGGGTERVVNELAALFPDVKLARMDRDTVGEKDAYRKILGDMRSGESKILVGTQMIAKGHDLPGVTLVGIIDADIGLHLPDFRSSEKVFQLITQAAGRAGRGKEPGRVLVQTRQPDHPTIVATVTGRFKAFARFELEQRRALKYPPWGRLLRVIISVADRRGALEAAEHVGNLVRSIVREMNSDKDPNALMVLGPTPAPIEKLSGRYRWHLLVKSQSARALSLLAQQLLYWKSQSKPNDVRVSVDIDPYDML